MKYNIAGFILALAAIAVSNDAAAQTIPEMLAQTDGPLVRTINVEPGLPPSLDELIAKADVIVRARVGFPVTYLSEDQKMVWSDYPLEDPLYAFPALAGATSRPGTINEIRVKHIGGTLTVDGRKVKVTFQQLPNLTPGAECLFFLNHEGDKYKISGGYYGAFVIDGDHAKQLAKVPLFVEELQAMSANAAVLELARRAAQLHGNR